MSAAAIPGSAPARTASRFAGMVSLGRSLVVGVLAPAAAFALLEPHFSPQSPVPLLAATLIPAAELAWTWLRRGAADAVAIISVSQFGVALMINILAHDKRAALVGHAWQPALLGLVFAVTALVGRPLIRPLARQAMCGDDPVAQARFDAVSHTPEASRRFALVTLMWTAGLSAQTAAQLAGLNLLAAKDYVLLSGVLHWAVNGALVWASIQYGRRVRGRMRSSGLPPAKSEQA